MSTATVQWQIGDEALMDMDVVTIEEIEPDGRIRGVKGNGYRMGSYDFRGRLFPVTPQGLELCAMYQAEKDKLHNMGNIGLNWPDLARAIEDLFAKSMKALMANDNDAAARAGVEAREFFNEVWSHVSHQQSIVVRDFFLFHRR